MNLPEQLDSTEGIWHTRYADDITIWVTNVSLGQMDEALQEAA